MKIVYFFTFDYTLKIWKESGNLERELEYFTFLNKKYGISFILVTYGDSSDNQIIKNINFIEVIPIYEYIKRNHSKFFRYMNSFKIPFILKNKINNFDVIKQNQLLGSWVAILFKFISKKPLMTRTGYDMYSFSVYEKKKTYIKFLYKLLTQFTLIFSDMYTVSSKIDKKFLESTFNFKKDKIRVLPNWVNNLKNNEISNRFKNKILAIGRLEKQKNFEYLISSFKNSDIEIDLYGEGNLNKELYNLSIKNNVKINFLGILPYSELLNIYKQYKVFISTSYFEGNPKTILEAMSSGCVVIASDIENNKEIIKNNENGLLFSFNDELIKIVNEILNDPQKIEKISNAAFRTVNQDNSCSKIASSEIAKLHEIIN